MIGTHLRAELARPLEGDRRFVRREEGPFVHRVHPELIGLIRAEKARLSVEEDIRNFRRMYTRERNMLAFG